MFLRAHKQGLFLATAGFLTIFGLACSDSPTSPGGGVRGPVLSDSSKHYTYRVVEEFPHDAAAFTQGLVIDSGTLFEGTGLNGSSSLRRVDLATGAVEQQIDIASQYFGEGIAVYNDRIVQLTFVSNKGFIYDKTTFESRGEFSYPTQGWGLTHDGARFIMSDGSANLYFLDSESLQRTGEVAVHDDTGPVTRLNELEFIEGFVFANIWFTDLIAVINPETGEVSAYIDLTGLAGSIDQGQGNVLNGIAFDADQNRLYVTGKRWPKLFEIELIPDGQPAPVALQRD